ncbi:MAG: transporter ATP-binding protein [Hyphomicrobiales bacterium]|nr:transporter ATP-binding protein [Hyphomicrobiales bacterium]
MHDTIPNPASILPLRVERLCFADAQARLLEDVSFAIPRGGLTIVLGANGAGKSLLMRLCQGLLAPTSGAVAWNAQPEGFSRHAMVFQKPVMLRRSARGNVLHALAASGVARAGRAGRADAALQRFGLADLSERPARLLSGGEQQRLAIARAVAAGPEILFLDEPTSHLDPGATLQVEQMLGGLKRDGVTLVMTTHDMGQARRLADRVLFMHKGRLIEDAAAHTFFEGPAAAEARAFLAGDLLW